MNIKQKTDITQYYITIKLFYKLPLPNIISVNSGVIPEKMNNSRLIIYCNIVRGEEQFNAFQCCWGYL